MAYQYRGTNRDTLETEPARRPAAPKGTFNPERCGTYSGYRQHQQSRTRACQPCKDAQSAYTRDYYEKRGGRPKVAIPSTRKRSVGKNPKNGSGCGTYNGHAAHKRAGTPACAPCLDALREYKRAREQARAAGDVGKRGPAPFDPARCGDYAGYKQHQRTGVPACLPCRQASAEHTKAYRAKAVAA
jgi:hypothetical protein